jgi:hypothetical protein
MFGIFKKLARHFAKFFNYGLLIRSDSYDRRTVWNLIRYPLLCPLGLILLILAHIFLAGGEIVLAITHQDSAYMFLFAGDFLALSLLCVKAYQRWRRVMTFSSRDGRKRRNHNSGTSRRASPTRRHTNRRINEERPDRNDSRKNSDIYVDIQS